jgi:MFS family permease
MYNAMFFAPTWIIYLQQEHGLSLLQVTWITVAYSSTSLLLSLPIGIIADSYGRKRSIAVALFSVIVGSMLFIFASSLLFLLVANVMFSVSFAFMFGPILSLFYASLKQIGREGEYLRHRGWFSTVTFGSAAAGSVLGGLLGAVDLRLPFVAYAGLIMFTFIVLISLKETPFEPHPETGLRISYRQALATMLNAIKRNPNLRYIFLYSNMLPLSTVIMGNVFMQPYAVSIGIPIAAMGIIAFGMHVVRMVGASCADKMVEIFGEWRWLSLAPVLVGVATLGTGLINAWPGILVFTLVGFSTITTRPLIETLMLRNAPGTIRSTILSIDQTLFNLFVILVQPWLGYVGDRWELPAAYLGMGGFSFVSLGLVLFFWRGVWKGTEEAVA